MMEQVTSKGKGNALARTLNYWHSKTHSQGVTILSKRNQDRNCENPQLLHKRYSTILLPKRSCQTWTSEPLMAAKKPKKHRDKTSKENEEDRVSLWAIKFTNAWWRSIHMPIKIFSQQWVDSYSYTALSGEHIILPIIYTCN